MRTFALLLGLLGVCTASVLYAQTQSFRAKFVSDTCVGTTVTTATTNIQALVDANPVGTTFCFAAGTYLPTSEVVPKNFNVFWGAPGAIWNGQSTLAYGIHGSGTEAGTISVTVRGLTFMNYTTVGLQMGWHWLVRSCVFHDNATGVVLNNYSTLTGSRVYHNSIYGVNGGPGFDFAILYNEIDDNNTSHDCGGACYGNAGASKIVGSTAGMYGLIWRGNYVHDNYGMGIWSDGNVYATYEYNLVTNNTDVGIFHEISHDALMRYNMLIDNDSGFVGLSCYNGAQIHLNDSDNVEIYGNTIIGNNGANAICAASADRPGDPPPFGQVVANMYVHDNVIYMKTGASTGQKQDSGSANLAAAINNRFVNNAYHVQSTAGTLWTWPSAAADPATWAQWQTASQDTGGSVVVWP